MSDQVSSRPAVAPELAPLRARCERAVRRARRTGREVLLAVTVPVAPTVAPSAAVFAPRRPGEPWFCFEQPDRAGAALAALGCVTRITGSGPQRFARAAAEWRALAGSAEADAPDGPPGAGLVAGGGGPVSRAGRPPPPPGGGAGGG